MFKITDAFSVFHDLDGAPLEDGFVYIGVHGLDAETNPQTVYFDSDKTIQASQPLRTLNGRIVKADGTTAANLYIATDYSIAVMDDNGANISRASFENAESTIATLNTQITTNTADIAKAVRGYAGVAEATAAASLNDYMLIGPHVYTEIDGAYSQTHEFQFEDAALDTWVREDMARINHKMPIVVIHTGQSNSGGFSGGNGGDIASQPNVWSYERHPTGNQTIGWKLGFKESPDFPTGQDGNHFGYHFCARLARETGRPVVMIPYSIGGQDIAEWLPSGGPSNIFSDDPQNDAGASGTLWANLISAWNQALTTALPFRTDGATLTSLGLTEADYLLWHQGEENRDSTTTYASGDQAIKFKRDLVRVFNAFLSPASAGAGVTDPLIRSDTSIIIGDLPYQGTDNIADRNPELYQIANEVTNISLAKIGWLPLSDSVHFDPNHIERIADFYHDQIGQNPFPEGWKITLADDALYEFRPSHEAGIYSIVETKGASRLHFEFGYRVSIGGGQITNISGADGTFSAEVHDNVDLNTLEHATNGTLAISARSGRIQIRNRRNASVTLRLQCQTPQALLAYGTPE